MTNIKMNSDFWKSVYTDGMADVSHQELPWNIGVPQPAISQLFTDFSSPILDAGCGIGVTSNYLAQLGKSPVVGVDISPAAIQQAKDFAAKLDLTDKVEFHVADISCLTGFDNFFHTIVDCTLFHSLPVELRTDYQRSVSKAARPGALYVVLVFADNAFGPSPSAEVPHGVSKKDLESILEPFWQVNSIEPAFIHTLPIAGKSIESVMNVAGYDQENRPKLPAWLAIAHKK